LNTDDIGKLMFLALANFPRLQEKDMGPTIALWEKMLSDIPYEVAEKALVKVLSTAKFFPTVAEIREAASSLVNPAIPSAAEAWGEVIQAIRRYGYYREEQALAHMSPATAQVVRWIGWKEICTCEEPDVIRGQFRRAYDEHAGNVRHNAVLPPGVRELISSATKALPGLQ